jgi:putative transposase
VPHFSCSLREVGPFHVHWSQTFVSSSSYVVNVPTGLKRFYGSGDLHFITASCYRREPLLGTARRRDLFLKSLEKIRQRYQFVVVGFVVMPEHVHLLISEPEKGNPSVVIQALKLAFLKRLFPTSLKKREKSGTLQLFADPPPKHFWQRRFYDFNVWSAHKRIEKLRYMHRNPVKRGLVETPDQWRWSSFRAYAYREPGLVRVNGWSVLKMKIRAA